MADMTTKILTVELKAEQAVKGIINLNNAIQKNTVDIKANNAMIAENNKKMKESGADVMKLTAQNQKLAQSNVELEAKTKVLKDEKRLLQKETQNEIKIQTQELGSMKQLEAELSNLKREYKNLSEAEREHGKRGIELREQINKTTTALKKAEYGIQEYYRNVGNYKNAVLGALGINNSFVGSLVSMGASGEDAGNALDGMGGDAVRTTSAMATLNVHAKALGKTLISLAKNPVFLAIAGIAGVGMAFKWIYDYNEGLAEATRLTREFTGLQGDNLVAFRNKVQATAEVMDKEFVDVLKTADSLMNNFHIDGEQAMGIINDGFAAGADLNGDMLDKIQRLAPAFRNAGMSAEQLVAVITQTRSGIFTDQGLEAIAMGTSRIRQFSDNMKKALQGIGIDAEEMGRKLRTGEMSPFAALTDISAKLQEISPNTQEYGKVVNEVFGKAGKTLSTEMVQGLADMSTSLDEVKAKTGEYGELLLENISTEEDLNNATSALFDLTNKGWEEVKQQAIIYAKKALVAVVKGLVDVTNWFINLYNKSLPVRVAVNAIATQFKVVWAVAKWALNNIINGFKTIGRGISAVVNGFSQAGNAIKAFGEGVALIFKGIGTGSWATIEEGWKKLSQGIKSSAQSAFDGLKAVVEQGAVDFVTDAKALGVEVGNAVMSGIQESVQGSFNPIKVPVLSGGGGGGSNNNNNLLEDLLDTTNNKGNKGGNKKGGGKGGSNKTDPKKTTTTKKEKTPEEIELERQQKVLKELLKKAQDLEKAALEEGAKVSIDGIKKKYKAQEDALKAAYGDLNKLTAEEQKQANEILTKLIADNNKKQEEEIKKFNEAQLKKQEEAQAKALAQAKNLAQTWFDAQTEGTQEFLDWQLTVMEMEKQAELALYEDNEEMKAAIIAKYARQEQEARKNNATAMMEIERAKYEAIGGMIGGLGEIMGEFGEENKEAVALQKTLAFAEILINQAVAISNAVKAGSNAANPWQMIAQIATSIVAVTTAMAQAFKSLNEAKFATGGYIRGAGTSTSDSIPVRVSNGESIMNAETTAMFGGLLSSLNQLGGGVPIQVQQTASSVRGEDMLARAVAKGVAMLPAPVVSVEDINKGQRQVEVMNERATL